MLNEGTSTKKRKSRATTRGYAPRAHEEPDSVPYTQGYSIKVEKDHKHSIRVYEEWLEEYGHEYDDDLSLQKGRKPLDLATLRSFFRFHAASAEGKLDPEKRITTESLVSFAEWFFASYKQITEVPIPDEDTSAVYKWVRTVLHREGIVVIREKPKYLFGESELVRFTTTFWTVDESRFLHPRNRVQIPFLIAIYCWTGARIGAFLPGVKDKTKAGLRYRDIELVLLPEPLKKEEKEELRRTSRHYRGWTACYRVDQRWTKANPDPTTLAHGSSTREHGKLLFDDTQYLIALAIADKAIRGVNSVEEFWALRIGLDQDSLVVPWTDEAKKLPILRNATMSGGVTDDPLSQSTFERVFRDIIRLSGYFGSPTIHAMRRGLGKKLDERYTPVQRSQQLLHTNERIFGTRYLPNTSSCDGKAAFLNEKPQYNHVDFFQSCAAQRENGLPIKLSAEKEAAIWRLPKIVELQNTIARLKDEKKDHVGADIKTFQKELRSELGKARNDGYKQYLNTWIEERRNLRIATRGEELPDDLVKTDLSQILYRIMPERARLARTMISDRIVTDDERRQSVQDLYSLATQDCEVVYRPDEKPVNGVCPVEKCGAQMSQKAKSERSSHIHACRRREVACQMKLPECELIYCYFCFEWFSKDAWDTHCRTHLDSIKSKCCEAITYCSTLVRPALCPFCLGDNRPGVSASERWKTWNRENQLRDHLREVHLKKVCWPSTCPHPLCNIELDNQVSFVYHLIDMHSLTMNEAQQKNLVSASYDGCQWKQQKRKVDNVTAHGPRPSKQLKLAQDQPRATVTCDSRDPVACALDTMASSPHCSVAPDDEAWYSEFIRSPSPSHNPLQHIEDGDSGYHTEQVIDQQASAPSPRQTSLEYREDSDSGYHTEQAVDQQASSPSPPHTFLEHREDGDSGYHTEQAVDLSASSIEEFSNKGPKTKVRLYLRQPRPPLQLQPKPFRLSLPKPPPKRQPRAAKSSHKAQLKPPRKVSLHRRLE